MLYRKHNYLKFYPETNNLTGQDVISVKQLRKKEFRIREINRYHIFKLYYYI